MNNEIGIFLEKLSTDIRDFSHHKVYGTVKPPMIDFDVSPLPPIILDQFWLDFCTAFGSSEFNTYIQFSNLSLVDYLLSKKRDPSVAARAALAVRYGLVKTVNEYFNLAKTGMNGALNLQILSKMIEDNGDYFDPLYQFSKIKQVRGEYTSWGANLRDAMKALVKYGSLPKKLAPFTFNENKPTDRDRNFLANWNNWPSSLDQEAVKNGLETFWIIDGPFDAFDNIRSTLYMNYQAGLKVGVLFGLNWRSEWYASIVKGTYDKSEGSAHCIWLRGQKMIDGEPYIILQQSGGRNEGDNGLFYLNRAAINKEFAAGFGAFTAKDLPLKTAGYFIENCIMAKDNWLMSMAKLVGTLISGIIK